MRPEQDNTAGQDELYLDVRLLNNLHDTAKWAKVLAILGFILSGFVLVFGLFLQRLVQNPALEQANIGFSGFTTLVYAFVAMVYFFPSLYLFQFAGRMQRGVQDRNRQQVHKAVSRLKVMFKFIVIMLALVLLLFVLSLLMLAVGRSSLAL